MPLFDQDQVVTDPIADLGPVEDAPTEVKTDPQPPAVPSEITQRLESIQTAVKGNDLLTKILATPGVQDVLRAAQNGQAVSVVPANQQAQPQAQPEPNWDELKDDPRKMSEYMINQIVGKLTPGVEDALNKRTQPLLQKVSEIESSLSKQVQDTAVRTLQEFKAKYSDADKMIPKMRELNTQTNGTLNYEQLYKLAKVESGLPLVTQDQIQTEKPTDSVARQPIQTQKKTYPPGRRGMRQAMNDVLDKAGLEDIFID
jgi:hypothetical protein